MKFSSDLLPKRFTSSASRLRTGTSAGGFQEPFPSGYTEGASRFGQYMRITTNIGPSGAGSQFDSWSLPGESFRMYRVIDPSRFCFNSGSIGELTRYRLIGLSISSWVRPSYMVIDQNAFTGGSCPGANVIW